MLILTLRQGKEVVIGNDISVTVLSIRGKTVRVGFDAPEEIPIEFVKEYSADELTDNNGNK